MPLTGIRPYRPPRPTIRELMQGRPEGEVEGGVPPEGYLGRRPKSAYRLEDRAEALRRVRAREIQPRRGTTSSKHTKQENNRKRAGRKQRGAERGEERTKRNYKEGINDWDAREGRPPGMAGDRQGPSHREAMGLDVSTERSRDRWLCSVDVRACREEGTSRQKVRRKETNKHERNPTAPQEGVQHKASGRQGNGTEQKGQTRDRGWRKEKTNKATKNSTKKHE